MKKTVRLKKTVLYFLHWRRIFELKEIYLNLDGSIPKDYKDCVDGTTPEAKEFIKKWEKVEKEKNNLRKQFREMRKKEKGET